MLRQFILSVITGYVLFDKKGQEMLNKTSKKVASYLKNKLKEVEDDRGNEELHRKDE